MRIVRSLTFNCELFAKSQGFEAEFFLPQRRTPVSQLGSMRAGVDLTREAL